MDPEGRILVVEDDEDIALVVEENLGREGYRVKVFRRGLDFYSAVEEERPDLVIVDIMLPDHDGFRIARFLKNRPDLSRVPVIFLTARSSEEDKLRGFDIGADDYITKPFSVKELVARVRAVIRRAGGKASPQVFRMSGLEIDMTAVSVRIDGRKVNLTPSEFKILKLLVENYGIPMSRSRIMEEIGSWEGTDRTVDVHIKHLRDKLGAYGRFVKTVRGFGYKFEG